MAKAFGYVDPSRSVRDICINLIKEAHITDGGLQILNFIRRHDVIRLFKHSRSENCYECLFFIDAVADDFAEKVFDKYIDGGGNDFDDDDPFECFGDCEDCPHYDECAADDEYEDDISSPEFREFLAEHTTDPVDEKRPYIGFLIQSIEEINNCLEDKGVFIAKAEIFSDNKPAYSLVKMGVEVKFYNMEVELNNCLETKHKGLYVIGDGSGVTHSLSHASASGIYVARNIIEEAKDFI